MAHAPLPLIRVRVHVRRTAAALSLQLFLIGCNHCFALQADQIALIVNSNVPEGRKLAELYAQERKLPAGRIIEVSLPATDPANPPEEILPALYDTQVVPAVRSFLTANHLDQKVVCLVTFWGMPLRISGRTVSPMGKAERAALETQLKDELTPKIERQVLSIEALARRLNLEYKSGTGTTIQQLAARAALATNAAFARIAGLEEGPARQSGFEQLLGVSEQLHGSDAALIRLADPQISKLAARLPTTQEARDAVKRLTAAAQEIRRLSADQQDAKSRERIRNLARENGGLLGYAEQIQLQIALLSDEQSVAALDSELALLWWPDYPKARWLPNPLNWRAAGRPATEHTLMVTRLDGPTVQIVRDIITTSVQVEQKGLHGQVALDGLGRAMNTPYGPYDQTIRHLASLLMHQTKLQVTFDDKDALFPAHSLKDIALYCGWYSVRNYVPPGQFNPGAIGFHVASWELVSLRTPGEKGWVRGLETDGVVATVGAVAEPYLQSFPPADEFFPLLLCGKAGLAEVFWRTSPWVSWMQTCIGDPLYRPYVKDPPVDPSVLPDAMLAPVQ